MGQREKSSGGRELTPLGRGPSRLRILHAFTSQCGSAANSASRRGLPSDYQRVWACADWAFEGRGCRADMQQWSRRMDEGHTMITPHQNITIVLVLRYLDVGLCADL